MRRRTDGFTLLELLVASVVALLLLGFVGSVLTSGLKIQARENQNIPVQQALRGSIEVITQDLRSAVGPRVAYSNMNASAGPPSGISASTNTSITILVPQFNSTFAVSPPALYPTTAQLSARVATAVQQGTISDNTTNAPIQNCSDVFKGSEYGVLYSTIYSQINPVYLPGAARFPDNSAAFQMSAVAPCVGGGSSVLLNHLPTLLPAVTWNPNTYIVEVVPVTYFVSGNTLYRQLAGQTAQVVAYNISALTITYLPDNVTVGVVNCSSATTFTTAPGCPPRSVNLTLTSVPQKAAVAGAQSLTASQIVFLR
jgi:prepilin-type N-terminal cleavage/methylation domain-containing protein